MKKSILIVLIIAFVAWIGSGWPLMAQSDEQEAPVVGQTPATQEQAPTDNPPPAESERFSAVKAELSKVEENTDDISQEPSLGGLSKRVSLDLRAMDIIDTIKFLSMKGNLNIVTSKNVKGRITLFLNNITIADVLDVILLTNDLACEEKNTIITIMTETEYEALYGRKYTDKKQIKTITLKYADVEKTLTILSNIKSTIGKVIADSQTGLIILIDTPEKIEEMEAAAKKVDLPTINRVIPMVTEVFELQYAEAEDIKSEVSEALTENLGTIRTDERTNKLVVTDLSHNMELIRGLIAAFDSKTRVVFIEAKIIEITLGEEFALGVNWELLFGSIPNANFLGNLPVTIDSFAGTMGRLALGTWKKGFYTDEGTADQAWIDGGMDPKRTQTALTFLSTLGKVEIISSPHIAVCNNEEAQIMVGTRQPYATSTVSQGETTATTSWSAEFVEIGMTLTVTPTINKDNFIRMHIKPEVSTLTEWFEITDDAGVAQIRLPVVDTSNAETDVLVEDGKTIIIAGLIRETTRESEDKIPFLGDIPFLGRLFKSTRTTKENKELVIFLTPHIIAGDETFASLEDVYSEEAYPEEDFLEEELLEEEPLEEEPPKEELPKEKPLEEELPEEDLSSEEPVYKDVPLEDSKQEDINYFKLGLSYEQDEDYPQAIREYEQALDINPKNTLAHLHLANIYAHHVVDFQKADRHFRWYKVLARGLK